MYDHLIGKTIEHVETRDMVGRDAFKDEVYWTLVVIFFTDGTTTTFSESGGDVWDSQEVAYLPEDEEDELEDPCSECGNEEAEEHGMCASCLHDAYRSGWQPGD